MTDSKQMLSVIFSVGEEIYKELSSDNVLSDHKKVFDRIIRLGKSVSDADRTSFWKWDKQNNTLWTTSALGEDRIEIPDDTGLVGKALKEKRVLIVNDPYNDPDFNQDVDKQTGYVTKSVLVIPVSNINGEYIGAFQAINKLGPGGFTEEDVRRLSLAAVICGISLESDLYFDEAQTDKLTGLRNRMGFYHDFTRRYNRIIADGTRISFFISDLDKFKKINDTYGHNAGDQMLKHVSDLLVSCCGPTDTVYRWGGEEFVLIMCGADLKDCVDKAEEMRKKVESTPCNISGIHVRATLSFGVCKYDPRKSVEDNMCIADDKLYTAKDSGRNQVVF